MPNSFPAQNPQQSLLLWTVTIILALVSFRLLSLGLYPLYDTTEARYGEMARLMYETQNWITPQFDYNVPFWGKPPFHTWISALSFQLFGVSEFFARLPHFLCGMVTCALVYQFTKHLTTSAKATFALLVLCSSLGFIIAIGMVMTDSALLMAYTLAMISFWHCFNHHKAALYGHLFFAAVALGMLIKGPVAVVLMAIALIIWSLWQGSFVKAIKSLPWKTGLPLCSLITLPWYLAAEIKTPGFLEYFIVGEHIQRFLVSGWEGDLYGSAHNKPRGTIWLYWLLCAFPWSFVLVKDAFDKVRGKVTKTSSQLSESPLKITPYLIGWVLAPLILFSLAGNILPIYVLPGFGAMAVLVAIRHDMTKKKQLAASATLAIVLVAVAAFSFGFTAKTNEAELLSNNLVNSQADSLYYWQKRPFSAQFYSNGKAILLNDKARFEDLLKQNQQFYFAIEHNQTQALVALASPMCQRQHQTSARILYLCTGQNKE